MNSYAVRSFEIIDAARGGWARVSVALSREPPPRDRLVVVGTRPLSNGLEVSPVG